MRRKLNDTLSRAVLLLRRRDIRIGGAAVLLVCVLVALAVAGWPGRSALGSVVSSHPQAIVQPNDVIEYASASEPAIKPTVGPAVGDEALGAAATSQNSPTVTRAQPDAAQTAVQPAPGNSVAKPGRRIGLQAGHWRESELPDELAALRASTGAAGSGWAERDVNLDIARRAAKLLETDGFQVDLLPSTVPVGYKADVFLSLHCDASNSTATNGFKAARAVRSAIPAADDALVAAIDREYGKATGMPLDEAHVTNNMRYYYALFGGRAQHAVAASTPAAILEMGFLTNAGDRQALMQSPDTIAHAVASSIETFLASR